MGKDDFFTQWHGQIVILHGKVEPKLILFINKKQLQYDKDEKGVPNNEALKRERFYGYWQWKRFFKRQCYAQSMKTPKDQS